MRWSASFSYPVAAVADIADAPLFRALLFTLPTFRSPLQPVLTPFSLPLINLLGAPRPRLSRSSIPTCCCILRKPRSIPYQPVRRRVFFRARGEARKHGQRRIDGGGQRIAILLLSVSRRAASPDFRCSSSIALPYSTDRDYRRRINGSDRKGYGFAEMLHVISITAQSSFNLPCLPFALT